VEYLRRAWELLVTVENGGAPTLINVHEPPPNSIGAPTLGDLMRYRLGDFSQGVAVDVEAAGDILRGIGFTRVADLHSLWCPFWRAGGAHYWPSRDQARHVVKWCDEILGNETITKVFHNGLNYDIPVQLVDAGFKVAGPIVDTMLLAHLHQPEMPKGLQWLSTAHLGIPSWKQLSKQAAGVDDDVE
jgi:hypothetical protein